MSAKPKIRCSYAPVLMSVRREQKVRRLAAAAGIRPESWLNQLLDRHLSKAPAHSFTKTKPLNNKTK